MKYFSVLAFEKLLFPMHKNVYLGIENAFREMEKNYPGCMDYIASLFDLFFSKPTSYASSIPDSGKKFGLPDFDIWIDVAEPDLKEIGKTQNYGTFLRKHEGSCVGKGNHLVISLDSKVQNSVFIVPLQLIMRKHERKVCKPNAYQVYEHTLIREKENSFLAKTREEQLHGSAAYIGITKRSWQKRLQEHTYASKRNSQVLFHRALRQELFPVETYEHQVLRAGLSAKEALKIEEVEVEERTLNAIHPNGLNMIPGGESGIRFMAAMTKKDRKSIDPDKIEFELEAVINSSLRQGEVGKNKKYKNEKLAALWRDKIDFRINAMTNREDRLSYKQILNARIWHAAKWTPEKILENLLKIEKRSISIEQVKRLLRGDTYSSIPHVIVDLEESESRSLNVPLVPLLIPEVSTPALLQNQENDNSCRVEESYELLKNR